jgi:TatA/E family protein of Tat protein translocase
MFLLIFEFIGTQEFVLILVAALILFGPRKLPELARSVGKSLSEFKRASEDFKDQWEREVEREAAGLREEVNSTLAPPSWENPSPPAVTEVNQTDQPQPEPASVLASQPEAPEVAPVGGKRDWL